MGYEVQTRPPLVIAGRWFRFLLCNICAWSGLVGCTRGANGRIDVVQADRTLLKESARLYASYLAGDASLARSSLREQAELTEGATWLLPQDKAKLLFVTYARLYVVHHRMKQSSEAEATWIKVRYWCLKRFELAGLDTEAAMSEVATFTSERMIEIIEAWDRRENKGKPPKYYPTGGASESPSK
jgi:hypothetical protein